MQDRLAELKPLLVGSQASAQDTRGPFDEEVDVELGDGGGYQAQGDVFQEEEQDGDSGVLQEFFETVNHMKSQMGIIRRNIRMIEEKHSQALSAVSLEQGKSSTAELEELANTTDSIIRELNQQLKEMQKENKHFADNNRGTAQARIRVNMHGTLTRQLMDLTSEYREIQAKYRQKHRERVQRQYLIVKPEATQNEIETALEAPSGEIFAQEILAPGHSAAKNALEDIQEQKREVLRLEASIRELHQLFVDMAVMVEAQGEMLDQIEYNVEAAVQYTEKGVQQLEKARKYQKKSRKNMIILIVILILIFIVILCILAVFSAFVATVLGITIPTATSLSG